MKYKVIMHYPNGTDEEEDELYDSEEQAEEAGRYGCSSLSRGRRDSQSFEPRRLSARRRRL